jgi:hypothetical protein
MFLTKLRYMSGELWEVNLMKCLMSMSGSIPYISEFKTHQIGTSVSGEANFGIILKGQNKFTDFEITVIKNPEDTLWIVERK